VADDKTEKINNKNINSKVISGASAASPRNLWRCMAPLSCHSPTLGRALTPKPIERRATPYHPCHPKISSAKRLRDYRRAFGVNWDLFPTRVNFK
jgi:hypothetical protein